MSRHVVARAEELPPGARRVVRVEGRAIVLFNVDGELYALRDRCPHQGAALSGGRVIRSLSSPCPGAYVWNEAAPLVRCPWHGWEYDLATGRSWWEPARSRVRSYPVERAAGPYVAETYAVERAGELIVLEL